MPKQGSVETRPSEAPGGARVADRILAVLASHGVDRVFGIPGGTISPLFDALADSGIELVVCQHEGMAAYLAYGYSRGTGRPGVVMVTSGPGILNAVTGLAAAHADEVPLILIGGEVQASFAARGALQDGGPEGLDVVSMLRPVTKLIDTLHQPQRAEAAVDRALRTAMEHPRGPVFLRLPVSSTTVDLPDVRLGRVSCPTSPPDAAMCGEIASLLASARRPTLLLGLGARVSGAGRAALELAEWLRCPVITDIEAKGVFPERHPLSLGLFGVGGTGAAADWLAKGPDVLLTIGARLDDTTTNAFSPLLRAEGTVVVQLDHDPRRLCRAYRADYALAADLPLALQEILRALPLPDALQVLEREAAIQGSRAAARPDPIGPLGSAPHDPRSVVRALQDAFGSRAVFTTDIGNHHIFATRGLVIDEPDAFHISNGLGGMGSGIGTAMGLALALRGERRVVGICGDGSALMVGNELATCARYKIPVVLAIFDDGQLGMVEHGMNHIFGRSAGYTSARADLVGFARALGATAVSVTDQDDLHRAATMACSGPLVLHIPIDPSVRTLNPRAEVLNFPKEGRT